MDADTERMCQQKLETSVKEVQYLQRQLDQANFRLQENLNHYKEFQMKRYEEIQTNRLKTIRKIEMLHQLLGIDKEAAPQVQCGKDSEVEISTQVRSEVAATIGFVEIPANDLMPLRSHNLTEAEERLDDWTIGQLRENIEHRDLHPNDDSLSSEQCNVDDCDIKQVYQLEEKSYAPLVQPGLDPEQSIKLENDQDFQMDISTQVHSTDVAVDIVGYNNLMPLKCHDVTVTVERLDDQLREIAPEHRDLHLNDESFLLEQCNVDDCDDDHVNQYIEKSVFYTNLALQPGTNSKQPTKRSNSQIRKNRQSNKRSEVTLKRFACDFQCHVCNKPLASKKALSDHLRIHTGEKPFECDIYHKLFRHSSTSSRHMKIHAEDKNHKPFVCDYCGEKYYYKRSLTSHILKCYKKVERSS